MSTITDLFRELRRRRVFRVAVVYAVVAWAISEIASVLFPTLLLPDWALRLLVVLAVLGFPVAIVLAWAYDLTPEGVVRTNDVETGRPSEGWSRPAQADGIVVLPFQNLSPLKEDEYFSDGVTEDLILQLHRIGSLRVISRSSAWQYKSAAVGAAQIASELGVAYLLEGSVRRSGSRVRIVAQLIDAQLDRHLWAETYEREMEDIFTIQTEVADHIASALKLTLASPSGQDGGQDRIPGGAAAPDPPQPPVSRLAATATNGDPASDGRQAALEGPEAAITSDIEAYDLYLKGRYLWNRRSPADLSESTTFLTAAIQRDPDFVRARSALAESYVTEALYSVRRPGEVLPLARQAADEALARAPSEAPALSALACVRAIYHWEWARAAAGFASAMRADPQYATAPQWLAMNVLVPQARFDEAFAELERARELDPICPSVRASFGIVEFLSGDYERAEARFSRLVAQDPELQIAHFFGGLCVLYGGDPAGAIGSFEKAVEVGGWSPEIASALGSALASSGRNDAGRAVLAELLRKSEERYVSPVRISQLYMALGDEPSALDQLELGVELRATELIWLDVFPALEELRGKARFEAIRSEVFAE